MAGLAIIKAVFFSVMLMATLEVTMSAVYNVGDAPGWTIGAFDYQQWASSKAFSVGDTLVFKYHSIQHNVMQVSVDDYNSCNNAATPIALYKSGEDKITLDKVGHYYFICSVGQHCSLGMKVDIDVTS